MSAVCLARKRRLYSQSTMADRIMEFSRRIKRHHRMSKKQWLVLLCLYVMYLLAGAAIFFYVEAKEEHRIAVAEQEERKKLEILLKEHFHGNYSVRKYLFSSLSQYCGKTLDINMSDDPYSYKWDFYHSLFFVITVVSTIGYGNLAPTTMLTRIFMIFYGLVGIPMNGIVIYTLGDFFGKSFTKLHQRWKNSKLEAKIDYDMARFGLIGQVILYLVPGFTFFIFLPSTIMTVFEGWDYDVSVYYSFVSLTTIGFGDKVAGVSDSYGFGFLYTVYQLFLLVWIIGGMGYVVMILSFITKGMHSKRIKQIEHMLSENLKNTPRKIRGELRSLLHELLFMRVKPVYKGEFEYVPSAIERSQSCPDLTMYKVESPKTKRRQRAMSECASRIVTLQRVQSESDLQRIDKEKTFMSNEDLVQQTELLFKVCNALSEESLHRIDSDTGGGVHGFSDKSILASEFYPITKKRRAISDIRPPSMLMQRETVNGNTWYGADADEAINEYRKRQRAKSVFEYKKPENLFKKIRNRLLSRDESGLDIEKQKIAEAAKTTLPDPPPYIRRDSILSKSPQEEILEQTSIADFIRAISALSGPEITDNISPRSRRQGIILSPSSRRASFVPDLGHAHLGTQRRFSLRPADESTLDPILIKKKEKKRKISSVSFQNERRGSLFSDGTTNIPPTLQENVPFGSVDNQQEPPHRRFSVRPVNLNATLQSPVQKQLQKRDRTDSTSSTNK
ncbi:open rectifier potassium channel protein 1 isoform X2 [Anthonomus grandis grandis]|uniref:open rectifier potassium channel protein 1 isoform X2 n=1 Tax=Anthonomus grandis grandis TaxID=2921223 RepID=UPI002166137E|nr:open rectifier potassium channel protein 1 isoform X2 [Anthonomus grandis grandis]